MRFKIIQDGKEIVCNVITTFKDEKTNITYIVYTDGTKDSNGELEVYASRYTIKDGSYFLNPIERDYEWDLVDKKLEDLDKES